MAGQKSKGQNVNCNLSHRPHTNSPLRQSFVGGTCFYVIITFSIAFTTRFIPVPKSPFHCFYEQPYPHFTCGQHISHIQPTSVRLQYCLSNMIQGQKHVQGHLFKYGCKNVIHIEPYILYSDDEHAPPTSPS